MSVEESYPTPQPPPRRRTSLLTWLVAIVVLLFAFGYFVVKPAAERLIQGATTAVGTLLGAALESVATLVANLYDAACRRVEQSEQAKALVGEPVRCAPIEECQWLDSANQEKLDFKFKFTGPQGRGEAHVVAVPIETGLQIKSIDVTGPNGAEARLPEP